MFNNFEELSIQYVYTDYLTQNTNYQIETLFSKIVKLILFKLLAKFLWHIT